MKVLVFGLGKLGLPFASLLAATGLHEVVGVDPAWEGIVRSPEPGLEELAGRVLGLGALRVVRSPEMDLDLHAEPFDIAFVVVPTNSTAMGTYDISLVLDVCHSIREHDAADIVVIVSTVNPGDCRTELREAVGRGVTLLYSPEFIALGNVLDGMANPEFVLLGCDSLVPEVFLRTIGPMVKPKQGDRLVVCVSTVEAEITKIAINSFVTMKISFTNMISDICEHTRGADAKRVLAAVGCDSRIGGKYLQPGGPYAGPCFPRDNTALIRYAYSVGAYPQLAVATDDVNAHAGTRVVEAVDRLSDTLKIKTIGILGLTYKPGTNVTDESLGLYLQEMLNEHLTDDRYEVVTYDPLVECLANTPAECIGPNIITVIANADPLWESLQYTRSAAVLDIWNVLDDAPHVHRLGLG